MISNYDEAHLNDRSLSEDEQNINKVRPYQLIKIARFLFRFHVFQCYNKTIQIRYKFATLLILYFRK